MFGSHSESFEKVEVIFMLSGFGDAALAKLSEDMLTGVDFHWLGAAFILRFNIGQQLAAAELQGCDWVELEVEGVRVRFEKQSDGWRQVALC